MSIHVPNVPVCLFRCRIQALRIVRNALIGPAFSTSYSSTAICQQHCDCIACGPVGLRARFAGWPSGLPVTSGSCFAIVVQRSCIELTHLS